MLPGAGMEPADPEVVRLVERIVATYHRPLREALPSFVRAADALARDAGSGLAAQELVAGTRRFADDLLAHLEQEEGVLFPLIRAGRYLLAPHALSLTESDHGDSLRAVRRLRALATELSTGAPPRDAARAFSALLDGLERDLPAHFDLEERVLFPLVLRLERDRSHR